MSEDVGTTSREPSGLPPRFDAYAPEVLDNPYPTYAQLRREAALCRGGAAQWVVPRYADVHAFLADARLQNCFPAVYHELAVGHGPTAEFMQHILLHHDRPKHTRLRQLLGHSFDARVLRALRARIGELVDDMLGAALETGRIEVVNELALPLPIRVVCELLGLPTEEWADIRPKASDLGRAFAPHVGATDRAAADLALGFLRDYIVAKLRERRAAPRDDLLSRMVAAERADRDLSEIDLVDNAVFLFFAGFETTSSMLATGVVALLEHPDQLARLQAEPELAPRAVEEFLRFDAPIQSRLRLVREPIEFAGRAIRPGRLLLLLVGSANRDEQKFHEPDRLDIARHPNRHLAFGGGEHFCLGAGLARIEGAIVFDWLARRVRSLAFEAAPERDLKSPFRTFARAAVTLRAR